ncbi:unnamed protein product [Hapterophycus canaliculatus]
MGGMGIIIIIIIIIIIRSSSSSDLKSWLASMLIRCCTKVAEQDRIGKKVRCPRDFVAKRTGSSSNCGGKGCRSRSRTAAVGIAARIQEMVCLKSYAYGG